MQYYSIGKLYKCFTVENVIKNFCNLLIHAYVLNKRIQKINLKRDYQNPFALIMAKPINKYNFFQNSILLRKTHLFYCTNICTL